VVRQLRVRRKPADAVRRRRAADACDLGLRERLHESDFAVDRKGDDHVVFTQTESRGERSVPGGNGDARVADCRKA
jgi:hypothetical protein